MLLLTMTYGGKLLRCSTRTEALEHQWHGMVQRIDPIQIRSAKEYGGWLQVNAPTVVFSPELCDPVIGLIATYPPPRQIQCTVQGTATTEAAAVTLCSGVLVLKSISETGIEYDLYSDPYLPTPSFGQTLAVQHSFNASDWHNSYQDGDRFLRASLDGGSAWGSAVQYLMPGGTSLASWAPSAHLVSGFFTQLASVLGLTLDASLASEVDPLISGTISSDSMILSVADSVAAYFGHYFMIENSILHLIDANADAGDPHSFGIWDYVRGPKYNWQAPVNAVYDSEGKTAIVGNTLFGQRINAGAAHYAPDAMYLRQIADYSEMPQIDLTVMDWYGQFRVGRHALWIDDRHAQDIAVELVMRAVQYEFGTTGDKMTVSGEGVIA